MTGLLAGLLVVTAVTIAPLRAQDAARPPLAAAERGQAGPIVQAPARGPRAGGPPVGRRGGVPPAPAPTSAEAEALFERFVLRQARVALGLTPAEMRTVEPRLRQFQATRRRVQRERARLLNDLAAATRGGTPVDEAMVRDRLQAVEEYRANAETAVREAMAKVDEVLTVEQRARFRVFERRVERQKLELLARARREAEAARVPPSPGEPVTP